MVRGKLKKSKGKEKKQKNKATELPLRQERFAQEVAKGVSSLSDAYRLVYSTENMKEKSVWEASSKLAANSKVLSRIEELRASALSYLQYDMNKYFEQLEEERQEAKALVSPAVSLKATIAKGRAAGHDIERKELTGPNGAPLMPSKIEILGMGEKKENNNAN